MNRNLSARRRRGAPANARLVLAAVGLGLLPAAARQVERAEAPEVVVAGDAEVAAEPDRAVVTLGATAQAAEAEAAQKQVNDAMQRALAAIEAAGVPEQHVQTSGVTLQPVHSDVRAVSPEEEPREPRIVAYRASHTVRVQLDDLSLLGTVIDGGIEAGANELHGVSFELRDDTVQRAEALRQALAAARRKAEALAEAAGMELGELRRIEEGGVRTFAPTGAWRAEAAAFDASTPIERGQVRVRASVTLTYRLHGPDGETPGER